MSKYVLETGEGYLGVAVVSGNRTATFGTNSYPVEWPDGLRVHAHRHDLGVLVADHRIANLEHVASYDIQGSRSRSRGKTLGIARPVIDTLEVEPGDDIRAYEWGDAVLLVPADPDPFVDGDAR